MPFARRNDPQVRLRALASASTSSRTELTHRPSSQVDAPSSPSGVDRLSKLPIELLQKIFDEAYAATKPTAPLSRTLLPLFDRCVWRHVKVVGDERLAGLCDTFQTRPSVGRHCRSLWIDRIRSPAVPQQALETVFANLPNLVKLTVCDKSEQLLDILLPIKRQAVLPFTPTIAHFAYLSNTSRTDPYDPVYLGTLPRMSRLAFLEIPFRVKAGAVKSSLPARGESIKIAPLEELSVSLSHEASLGSLCTLLQGVPIVMKLVLKDYNDPSRLAKLICALASPDKLEHLVLCTVGTPSVLPVELKHLTGLKQLEFSGDFSRLGGESFNVLRALPLECIAVGRRSDISAYELASLVDGPKKLWSLKKLKLINVDGKAGDLEDVHLEDDELEMEPHGWTLPKWSVEFAYIDFLRLKARARDGNVAISGTVKRAARVQDDYEMRIMDLEDCMYSDYDSSEEDWLGCG